MGYTREQLEAAGFKPEPEARPERLTREQLEAMGFAPVMDPMAPQAVDLSRPYEPQINPARAAVLGASQGATLGFGEELGAAAGSLARQADPVILGSQFALSPDDTPEIRQIKLAALDQQLEAVRNDPQSYENLRDRMRAELAQAQRQRPREYRAGEMVGSLATAPILPGPSFTGSQARNALALLGSGAGYGAAAGMGASTAPLTSQEALEDVATGAGMGLGGAVVGAGAGKALRPLARALQRRGIESGRKVLLSGADQLTRTTTPDEVVREALESKAITPFGTTESAARKLTEAASEQGKKYAAILAELEQLGVRGERVRDLATQMIERAAEDYGASGANKRVANLFLREAQNIETLAGKDDALKLLQLEGLKRDLQDIARSEYGKAGGSSRLGEAKEEAASMVRQFIEDAVEAARKTAPAGSPLATAGERFIPVKQRDARLIQARKAAEKGLQRVQGRAEPSVLPNAIELAAAAATGNPGPILTAPLRAVSQRIARNRWPSFSAATQFGLGRALERVPAASSLRAGTSYGGAVGRAIGMEPEEPLASEVQPVGTEADFERWRLEQELRGQALPAGAPLRRLITKGRK